MTTKAVSEETREERRTGPWLVVVIAAAVPVVATLVLRPRGLVEPVGVDVRDYFSPEEIRRGEDFQGPQRLLAVGSMAISYLTLGWLALRPPRRVRKAFEGLAARPVLGGAAVGAGLSLFLSLVDLPLAAVAHQRSRTVGLATQTWGPWFTDLAIAAAIGVVLSAMGAALLLALVRRFPRRWWIPGAVAVAAVTALFTFLQPVLLAPIFNRFEPVPEGRLRTEVLDLARRADVDVGEVYRMDASRRTTGANAYVTGLGETKRVVLFDTLLSDFRPQEVRSVTAHELGHAKYGDLYLQLLWLAVVAPATMLVAQRLAERLATASGASPVASGQASPRAQAQQRRSWLGRRRGSKGERPRSPVGAPGALPGLVLAVSLAFFVTTTLASNAFSRGLEARADALALELTRDPRALIGVQRRLVAQNVGDPTPPLAYHLVFEGHPTTLERIGAAEAWARRGG